MFIISLSKFWLHKAVACLEPKHVSFNIILLLKICCCHPKGWGFFDHNSRVHYFFKTGFQLTLKLFSMLSTASCPGRSKMGWWDEQQCSYHPNFDFILECQVSSTSSKYAGLPRGTWIPLALAKICAPTCCIPCSRRQSIFSKLCCFSLYYIFNKEYFSALFLWERPKLTYL